MPAALPMDAGGGDRSVTESKAKATEAVIPAAPPPVGGPGATPCPGRLRVGVWAGAGGEPDHGGGAWASCTRYAAGRPCGRLGRPSGSDTRTSRMSAVVTGRGQPPPPGPGGRSSGGACCCHSCSHRAMPAQAGGSGTHTVDVLRAQPGPAARDSPPAAMQRGHGGRASPRGRLRRSQRPAARDRSPERLGCMWRFGRPGAGGRGRSPPAREPPAPRWLADWLAGKLATGQAGCQGTH